MRRLALNDHDRAAADRLLAEFLGGYERAIPGPRIVPEVDREALSTSSPTGCPTSEPRVNSEDVAQEAEGWPRR